MFETMIYDNRNYKGYWKKTPAKIILIFLIRLYQITLSPIIGKQCRFLPTCSEYAYEAIARYGLFRGSILTFLRLLRCAPWGTHGYDPVPLWNSRKEFWLNVLRFNKRKKNDIN